jgi:hypothetical protein
VRNRKKLGVSVDMIAGLAAEGDHGSEGIKIK